MPGANFNHHSGRGGGRGGGRSSGRSGGRGGGRGGPSNSNGSTSDIPEARFRPCRDFTTTGNCRHGNNCTFAHIVTRHADIVATSKKPQQQQQRSQHHNNRNPRFNNSNVTDEMVGCSCIGIWEQSQSAAQTATAAIATTPTNASNNDNKVIKIFSGSEDGFWRLWNSMDNFRKELEYDMNGKIALMEVLQDQFLVVGFLGSHVSLPKRTVGMVQVWNLQQPSAPPMECLYHKNYTPYAHTMQVTAFTSNMTDGIIYTGSRDATIHSWKLDPESNCFTHVHSYLGHVSEVTDLLLSSQNHLWSCSTDESIRTWNTQTSECQYVITESSNHGHTKAVTALEKLQQNNEEYIISASLDGDIKAWNATNGTCMATINHGVGLTCMTILHLTPEKPILLLGCETGKIMIRSVLQTPSTPAFTLLATLYSRYTCGHDSCVKTIRSGPSQTFYSGGDDGKLLVWQITNDLGL